jgi:hypothetical protein
MFRQNNPTESRKLYSLHVLPSGRDFTGTIGIGKANYRLTFAPRTASVVNRKLVLTGTVTVQSPGGQKRVADKVEATLLATQGSAAQAPALPRTFAQSLKPATTVPDSSMVITEATGDLSSVGVMYLKLSTLNGKALGVPLDLSSVQLNARLLPGSEVERDLQWLYSALVIANLSKSPDEQAATNYLAEINRILKA